MKNYIAIAFLLTSYSSFGPKPHVTYHNKELHKNVGKIVVFTTTDFTGNVTKGAKYVDVSINLGWASTYGAKNIIPTGPVIKEVIKKVGNESYMNMISVMDNVSGVEATKNNPKLKEFTAKIFDKLGNAQFALALISGGEAECNAGKTASLHLN